MFQQGLRRQGKTPGDAQGKGLGIHDSQIVFTGNIRYIAEYKTTASLIQEHLSPVPPVMEQKYKPTAWNGISFTAPPSWYPVVVLANYLLFEEEYAPVFELKWQQLKGRFSAESVLKRLGSLLPDTSAAPWTPPHEWTHVLKRFDIFGFTWKNNQGQGKGLLLHYAPGNQVLLLRFHRPLTASSPVFPQLFNSLRFEDGNSHIPWMLFDIEARLPREAKLQSHEFLTGKYSLVFTLAGLHFSLLRFKPAGEILQDSSLLDFGKKLAGKGWPTPSSTPLIQRWTYRTKGMARVMDILRRTPTCTDMQLQHFPEYNTILGIKVQGNSPRTGLLLDEIRDHYRPV